MQTCDLLIAGGSIVDGLGGAAWAGDVAVVGDRIVAIGDCGDWQGRRRIDATGLLVCPGFIDAHAHDDRLLFDDPAMQPKVSQGVTTVIVGNCGLSVAPLTREKLPDPLYELANGFSFSSFASYLNALEARQPATNAACLVGHTTIRVEVMAAIDRRANPDEMAAMRQLCSEAMAAGAIGLSSGLFYPPAQAADWTEVAELVETVGAASGIYTAHIRDEAAAGLRRRARCRWSFRITR
jgi:N-acyl-D-amino-acid deacylase